MSDPHPESVPTIQVNDLALSLLLSRLDTQDKSLEFILKEARKTNGSVRDLNGRVGAIEAASLVERVATLETAQRVEDSVASDRKQIVETRRDTRRWTATLVAMACSGAAGAAGHALHLW